MGGINPTDMQVNMTKSVDVARQYSQEAHKLIANQQNELKDGEKLQEENTKRVHERNLTERIQKDEEANKEKSKHEKEENNDSDKDEEEKEEAVNKEIQKKYPEVRGHFDKTV